LRDNIGSHQIRPGERLQEVSLAAQLGVSRTPCAKPWPAWKAKA
jgi:DNA-binding GntR family transcriptional regulator